MWVRTQIAISCFPSDACTHSACLQAGVSEPAGVCAACGDGELTNFVTVVDPRGATVPWIEAAAKPAEAGGAMEAAEEAKAAEAAKAAEGVGEAPGGDARSDPENARSHTEAK